MGNSLPKAAESVCRAEMARFGRELSQNERACAISHSHARAIIAASKHGGLVLEDDARIIHLFNLETVVSEFLSFSESLPHALGLLDYRQSQTLDNSGTDRPKIHRLLAEVPLAVATALTPCAAREFLQSAATTSQVADWPNSRCKFYITTTGPIRHGDADTDSVIGETSSRIYVKSPRAYTKIGFLSRHRRLLQKIDAYLIRYHQSK
jgi:GR25 family glycosyltransferase involved in LPS biosynthesis